jgi:hypothetical protein
MGDFMGWECYVKNARISQSINQIDNDERYHTEVDLGSNILN